jgi:hypothetical protein
VTLSLRPVRWPYTVSVMFATQSYRHLLAAERAIASDIENSETSPAARAQLARALCAVLEEKRIMRMRPAPRPVDVPQPTNKARRSSEYRGPFHDDGTPMLATPDTPIEQDMDTQVWRNSSAAAQCIATPEIEAKQPTVILTTARRVPKPKLS